MIFLFRNTSVFAVLLFVLSCVNDPDCYQELPYDQFNVSFFDIDDVDTEIEVEFDRVGVVELGSERIDSILYESDEVLHTFTLPLNPSNDTASFYFITGVTRDTLIVSYSRQLKWLSEECGPNFSYSDFGIVKSTFDSTGLISSSINELLDENIRIYN